MQHPHSVQGSSFNAAVSARLSLTIADVSIRQDAEGRYCLNDLHKAAGGEKRHQPSDWLRIQQTIDLIKEAEIPGIPGIQSKQGLGTFVHKDLVYAYAMWISPAFHLRVIRAYDAMVTAPPAPMIPQSLPEALRLAADLAEQKAQVEERLAIAAPKAAALDRMALADGEVSLQTAGKLLQQRPNKFIAWLRSLGTWIFKNRGSSRNSAYVDKINAGYLNVRTTTILMPDGSERVTEQVVVTPKGLAKLAQMLDVDLSVHAMGGATQ